MSIAARWYLKDGRLYCKQCRKPAADASRGKEHSVCWARPSQGRGHPTDAEEPFKLTEGKNGTPTDRLLRYISYDNTPYERALKRLYDRYPRYAEVYYAHVSGPETLEMIARRLGISPANAQKRKQRGRKLMAQYLERAGGNPDDA